MHQIVPFILNQSVKQSVERPHRSIYTERFDPQEGFDGEFWLTGEPVTSNDVYEQFLAGFDSRTVQSRENLFDVFELARSREFLDNGVIGIVIMGESRVVFACVVENLKGEVEILLASDH